MKNNKLIKINKLFKEFIQLLNKNIINNYLKYF